MNVQTYAGYNPVGRWGCYFCSLAKIAEDVTGDTLTDGQVRAVYQEAVNINAMSNMCFMKHPDMVLNLFMWELAGETMRAKYIGWWNADTGLEMFGEWEEGDATHEVIRRQYKSGYHFGLHNWNPDPRLKCGPMNGRRLFFVAPMEEKRAA